MTGLKTACSTQRLTGAQLLPFLTKCLQTHGMLQLTCRPWPGSRQRAAPGAWLAHSCSPFSQSTS